jgi:hypothetical protein
MNRELEDSQSRIPSKMTKILKQFKSPENIALTIKLH